MQLLWERGLWIEGMKKKIPIDEADYPELCATQVLSSCSNFQQEKSAMEKLVWSYGHLIEFAPKGHPECAECGIEYDNGVAKRHFRNHNLQIGKNCEKDTKKAYLSITLQTSKRTARKARTYMRAYMDDSGGSHYLIEKYVKQVKCHRNILDMDLRELQDLEQKQRDDLKCVLIKMEQNEKEMVDEKILIAKLDKEVEQDKKQNQKST